MPYVHHPRDCKATVKAAIERSLSGSLQLYRHFKAVRNSIPAMHDSAASLNAISNDGKSQASPARLTLARKFWPVEGPEHVFEFIFRETWAAISDGNKNLASFFFGRDVNGTG
jgi:hypothetical protein